MLENKFSGTYLQVYSKIFPFHQSLKKRWSERRITYLSAVELNHKERVMYCRFAFFTLRFRKSNEFQILKQKLVSIGKWFTMVITQLSSRHCVFKIVYEGNYSSQLKELKQEINYASPLALYYLLSSFFKT